MMPWSAIGALGLAGMLAACAQTPPVPGGADATAVAPGAADTPLQCARPVYPAQAAANKIEGTSTVGLLIDPDGRVINSRLYTSSGDASLDEAARSALVKCRFKPATSKGKPVTAWAPVQYVWSLK